MVGTEPALRLADSDRDPLDLARGGLAAREERVQLALQSHHTLAELAGFGLVAVHECAEPLTLLAREPEAVGVLQRVHRPRIAVELGRLRQAHASAREEVFHLLLRQRLDLA